jgi:hypothetical protein
VYYAFNVDPLVLGMNILCYRSETGGLALAIVHKRPQVGGGRGLEALGRLASQILFSADKSKMVNCVSASASAQHIEAPVNTNNNLPDS